MEQKHNQLRIVGQKKVLLPPPTIQIFTQMGFTRRRPSKLIRGKGSSYSSAKTFKLRTAVTTWKSLTRMGQFSREREKGKNRDPRIQNPLSVRVQS